MAEVSRAVCSEEWQMDLNLDTNSDHSPNNNLSLKLTNIEASRTRGLWNGTIMVTMGLSSMNANQYKSLVDEPILITEERVALAKERKNNEYSTNSYMQMDDNGNDGRNIGNVE